MDGSTRRPRRFTVSAKAACLLSLLVVGAPFWPLLAAQTGQAPTEIRTVHVRENVWMLVTPGGNLALQVGEDGALLVDTGRSGTGEAVLAAIRQITKQPLRYVINTSAGPDQIGNNVAFGRLAGGATDGRGAGPIPAIIAHEAVLTRMSAPGAQGTPASPVAGWPSDAYTGRQRSIRYNGEAIDIIHQPSAYSDGDSIVYFRRSDVVVAGEIFSTRRFPLVDREHGGSVGGVLAGLNRILDIAVPDVVVDSFAEDGTLIIPGSGRLSDEDDVTEYRDMVHIVRDRVAKLVATRLDVEQVKKARPLIDYEARYSIPGLTPATFIDALYADVVHAATAEGEASTGGGPRGSAR